MKKTISELLSQNISKIESIVNLANLGYCELFDFKCAGSPLQD